MLLMQLPTHLLTNTTIFNNLSSLGIVLSPQKRNIITYKILSCFEEFLYKKLVNFIYFSQIFSHSISPRKYCFQASPML